MPIPWAPASWVWQVQVFRGLDEVVSAPFEAGTELLARDGFTEGSWPFFFPKKQNTHRKHHFFTLPFVWSTGFCRGFQKIGSFGDIQVPGDSIGDDFNPPVRGHLSFKSVTCSKRSQSQNGHVLFLP